MSPMVGGKDVTTNPRYQRTYLTEGGMGITTERQPQPNEIIDPANFQAAQAAYNASVFETSIGETAGAPAAATTGIGLTPIVIVGGLLLLLFMMSKGRF